MIKSDLLKLVEAIADDGDINEILLGSDEFKWLKDLSKLNAEDITGILAGETFKNGKMQDEIKKAVEAATNKKKTPEQEELEKLKKQFEDSQAELTKERTMNKLSATLKDKNLPIELANFAYGDGQEETINKNIDTLQGILNNAVDSGVKAKLGTSSYTPPTDAQTNALNTQIASAMGVQ